MYTHSDFKQVCYGSGWRHPGMESSLSFSDTIFPPERSCHNDLRTGTISGTKSELSIWMWAWRKCSTYLSRTFHPGVKINVYSLPEENFDPRAFEAEPAVRHSSPFPAPPPRDNSIASPPPPLLAPPPKTSKRHSNQNAQNTQNVQNNQNAHNVQSQPPVQGINGSDLFGSTPFSMPNTTFQQMPPAAHANTPFQSKPNYDISDFDLQTSVFANAAALANGFNGYDPFDTQKAGNNIFSNGYGNAFNGFGNLSEKQTVELDSNFNGFLDKTISEMKDGFSRGITFGNDDFSIDNLDPLKKN
ncbi:hypothetical protein EVAR_5337_1 [Eumeta japonica]|uniref:Uncharacterized protein n=1 Tax=Eumeta variegata TaxID=151549 RepID=A0A4C1TM98_EUMVA|nr:hypothetical protein EVAR_5337_1 [Eumeta japonica]